MKNVEHLLDLTDNFWNIEDFSADEDMIIIQNRVKYFQWFFYYFLCVGILTAFIGYFYKPFFTNSRVLIYDGSVPENDILYYMLLMLETYSMWITGFANISFDLFFAAMLMFASAQFRMLGIEIRNLISSKVHDDEKRIVIRQRLKKSIDHHNFLLG